jgi:endonuclease YncB( thermonuclease family)
MKGVIMFRNLLALMLVAGAATTAFAAERSIQGYVTKIVDGDTIHFHAADAPSTVSDLNVRLLGMDAPESHFKGADGEWHNQGPWGEAAAKYLAKLIPVETNIVLESHGLDRYHRVLGRLLYRKHDVNLKMVSDGMAIPYLICEGDDCDESFFAREHVAEYLDACRSARSEQAGAIWNKEHPLKEMPFEFRMRLARQRPSKLVGDFRTRKLYSPSQYKSVDVCDRIFFFKAEDARRAGFDY